MKEVCLRLLDDLALAMEEDSRLVLLRHDEEAMLADPISSALLTDMNKKGEVYQRLRLELGEKDEETIKAKRELAEAKRLLDENEFGEKYRHSYATVALLYKELDEIVFGPYREHASCKEKHAAR
ncbi:MAG: YlbF family regulator [Bacilli bacterium]|nr:YlbF family regulator [Bacilli bacterium]